MDRETWRALVHGVAKSRTQLCDWTELNKYICPHKDLGMNIHSSFIKNTQNWKQPKCPTTGEWINKLWFNHTTEYHFEIKINSWHVTWHSRKSKTRDRKVKWVVPKGEWHGDGTDSKGAQGTCRGKGNILYLHWNGGQMTACICPSSSSCVLKKKTTGDFYHM